MGINSALKVLFNNRLAVGSSVPFRWLSGAVGIVMLTIFFIASSFTKRSDRDLRAKEVNLIIRQMGHQLLRQAGDSTSRVLPVTEIKKGTFLLEFENEFVFNHDSLMTLSLALLPKTQFPSGYTVTVHECLKARIVYGFQRNNTSPDILACRGRKEPTGCYTIEITFPDFYESVEPENVQHENVEQENVEKEAVEHKKIEQRKAALDQPAEELKSFKVDPLGSNPIPIAPDSHRDGTKEFKSTAFDYPLINLVYGGMLVLGITLLIGRFGKILKPVPPSYWRQPGGRQNQNQAVIKESGLELAALGKFSFDVKGQRLLSMAPDNYRDGMESEVIRLTDKECKILELLNNNFGELVPRETLMQKIWINEGVITGRSLDVFVSKLRKKLSRDPDLRITNVHGKGYKLEISGIQI